ncbi:MAG TPA: MFS transporter [Bacillota bacterium]|nr:MFS transporter [Bacillota bacterium]
MAQQSKTNQTWPILLFTIGVFMAGLDNGIIGTALTTINESFGVPPDWGAWSITLYTLGIAVSVPIIGKFSDRYGRRRLFIIEITLFAIGSLFVALSPNFIVLLLSRFIQAIGGGGIFIIGSAHILATLPQEKQGKALGLLGSMHGLSAIIGPNLGAIILSVTGNWQWMFFINLPIAFFLIIFGYLKIPETRAEVTKPLDIRGIILLTISILAMMIGLTNIDHSNFLMSLIDVRVIIFMAIGWISLLMFIAYERQLAQFKGDPIISYRLMSRGSFQMTLFLGLLSGGFISGIMFIPSYVQQVLLIPVEKAGFWVTPLALASGIGAGFGGFLTDKIGAVRTVILSGFIAIVGFLLFPYWVNDLTTFVIASVIGGVGFGFLLGAPLNVLAGEDAKKHDKGSALGMLSLARQMGLVVFPTLFAGFIAKGFLQVKQAVNYVADDVITVDMTVTDTSQDAYLSIIQQINNLPDQDLQASLLETIAHVLKTGYDQMFLVSGILALFVIIAGIQHLKYKR